MQALPTLILILILIILLLLPADDAPATLISPPAWPPICSKSHQNMSTITASEPMPGVDRRANLSQAEFERTYLLPRRPVVITDALQAWPALGRWTPQYFRDRFSNRTVNVGENHRALGPFIDEVLASTPANPAPYLHNEDLGAVFPELTGDIQPLPSYFRNNWLNHDFRLDDARFLTRVGKPEFYLGGAGQSFPAVHYDYIHTHAFLMQLFGQKQYFVYAPDQTAFMYAAPGDANRSLINNVEHPDLEKYPLFAQARGHTFTLDPGETLFIPSGWWHTVRIVTTSITVSVNLANGSNWKPVREDYSRLPHRRRFESIRLDAYLRFIGAKNRVAELLR